MSGGRVERRLAAVLAADIAGYSRLMGADELGTLEALKAHRRDVVDPAIASHKGRIVKTTGDGMLVEFASAVDAVTCAMAVQEKMADRNGSFRPVIDFRIGINIGDIIIDGDDIFGDGVNIAARVESECEPGGVYLSGTAFEQVRGKTAFAFDDLGERSLKNIDRPVRLYSARLVGSAEGAKIPRIDSTKTPLPDKPSIAVLPFQNMSGDPEQEYFADGIAEDIITGLSRFQSLLVIARNSSFAYKGKSVNVKLVGRELGVRYVLEGSVRKAGGKVRITGQLVEAASGTHLWADRFDGRVEDVFDLQDRVTEQVIGTIAPMVRKAEIERLKIKRTENLDAYDTLLRGLAELQKVTFEGTMTAIQLFKRAIELDPDYAPAYGRAAYCYVQLNGNGWITERVKQTADALYLARRAIELGSDDAEVMTDAAVTIGNVGRDLPQFFAINRRAIELNPNRPLAWSLNGWGHVFAGEHELAIEDFHRAIRLNPSNTSNFASTGMAMANLLLKRYDESFVWAERAYAQSWEGPTALRLLATTAALTGQTVRANEIITKMLTAEPNATLTKVERHLRVVPYQREQDIQIQLKGLRAAGLPE